MADAGATGLASLGGLGFAGFAVLVGAVRPTALLPLLLVLAPLRLPLTLPPFGPADLPTIFLLGCAAGRAGALWRAARREPVVLAALLALPIWMLVSTAWASQPFFAVREAGKWAAVSLAALVALADERPDPRAIVIAAAIALVPSALWAVGERLQVIAPLGEIEELRLRLIEMGGVVRGRALFYHPNRLAEFVEQIGLLLAACAVLGPLRPLCAFGAVIAAAGSWASGSSAGLATMVGGGVITATSAALFAHRPAAGASARPASAGSASSSDAAPRRHRALWYALAAVVLAGALAAALALVLYRSHGGLGPRQFVYRYAWQLIQERPLLGLGGGNWALEVGRAPLHVNRFWFRSHTHSLPLQLWVEAGLIGLVLGGAFFAAPIGRALRGLSRCAPAWRGVAAGSVAGVLGLLAHDVVHFFLRQPADGIATGLLLGLGVGAAARSAGPGAGASA